MLGWIPILLVAASTGIFLLLFYTLRHLFRHPKPPPPLPPIPPLSRRKISSKTLFNWSDNPTLITDAIENGWSRFAFTEYTSSSSLRSNRSFLLTSCTARDSATGGDVDDVEISWEVCQESADFMQKIRLNSGLNTIPNYTTCSLMTGLAATSVIKSALPLPGPALANSSPFPQEAYFEITILQLSVNDNVNVFNGNGNGNGNGSGGKGKLKYGEDENVMLIEQKGGLNGRDGNVKFEELRGRSCTKDEAGGGNEGIIMLSVGLTCGGSLPVKLPGSYPGSVGFNSDGSVYLDGIKLMRESNIQRWKTNNKVIGCGYNPSEKKVIFTIDSKLVHEITCNGEEFKTPLYPTLAANKDVTVLVNFGQSSFKYAPANLQRTPNPCFVGSMANSSSLGFEDSKELFSMGKLDSQWLSPTVARSGPHLGIVNKEMIQEYDEAFEGDLFEIVIESNNYKRSPINPS